MKVVAIIQARLQSTRLPRKILLPMSGERTALQCMLDRVKLAKRVDKIVIAASDSAGDTDLYAYLDSIGQPYFAGSEDDVLSRYYETAKKFCEPDDIVVRLTSDCPVIDPVILDKVIDHYIQERADFASNSLEPYSFPDGMDTEVFSFKNLERAAKEAVLPSHREHVTFYFWQNPQLFKIAYLKNDKNLSAYRLTLDYPADYELLKQIYAHFSPRNDFSMNEIIDYLEANPEIKQLNSEAVRNAGWQSALKKDQAL
jgi:spore coat polysaccharide biosynthesis protein SpsF